MKYNNSTDDLPGNVLLVDRREDLLEIKYGKTNLVLWRREEDPSITDFFTRIPEAFAYDDSRDGFESQVGELYEHPGRSAFLEEYKRLYEIMEKLQDGNESVLSVIDVAVEGYEFHQDAGYSLNWTLAGPPALWVENRHVKPISNRNYESPNNLSVIRQFPAHWVAVYLGMTSEQRKKFPEILPFVHSRPDRPAVRRALHQIYL